MADIDVLSPSDSSSLVYHFTSLSTALEKILKEGSLRLGPLRETNDPRESHNSPRVISWIGDRIPDSTRRSKVSEMWWSVKDHCQLSCAAADDIYVPSFRQVCQDREAKLYQMQWDGYEKKLVPRLLS